LGEGYPGRLADAQAALRALGVTELTLPDDVAERLATLRVETELKLPDCCVLLAAEDAGATVFTLDDRLAREAERMGLGP
jgi:predicted nucleic acid-binding protein